MKKAICFFLLLPLLFVFYSQAQTVTPVRSFGDCGTFTSTFNTYTPYIRHTMITPGGKILSGGHATVSSFSYDIHTVFAQYNPDGSPDPTFGINGKVDISLNTRTVAEYFTLQPDGKIIVVGTDAPDNSGSAHIPVIFRLNANGSVDNTFGTNGQTAVRFDNLSSGSLTKVAILPDGKILASGVSAANANGGTGGIGIMKFNADGSLDNSFGNIPGFPGRSRVSKLYAGAASMLVQADGSIVLVYGRDVSGNGSPVNAELVRFFPDGTLDNSFGGAGTLVVPGINMEGILSAVMQTDGKILISTTTNNEFSPSVPTFLRVARLMPDYSVDASFGNGGISALPDIDGSGLSFYNTNIAVQPDGKILISGGRTSGYPNNAPVVIRLSSTGQLDLSFNGTGYYFLPASITVYQLLEVLPEDNQSFFVSSTENFRLTKLSTANQTPTAGALNFDGFDDKVALGNWFNEQVFSVEMWIKPGASQSAPYAAVIDNNDMWQLYRSLGTSAEFYFYVADNNYPSGGRWLFVELTPGAWQHIVLVKDVANVYVYKNGVEVATSAFAGSIPYSGTPPLWLGGATPAGRGWNGTMDELRFWNRALCQAEIQNNMNCQLSPGQSGLMAYYKFNQDFAGCNNSETSLIDASGNNHHGNLQNFSLSGSVSNWLKGHVNGECSPFNMTTYYTDADGDGYGVGAGQLYCVNPGTGYAAQNGDCDDTKATVHPGATELCGNSIDDDCDGQIDEGCIVFKTLYRSFQSGDWNALATWESSADKGVTWSAASGTPAAADSIIAIRENHIVSIPSGITINADELIINLNGSLVVDGILNLNEGSGTDLENNGNLTVNNTLEGPGQLTNNNVLVHNAGIALLKNISLTNPGTLHIVAGELKLEQVQINNSNIVTIETGAILSNFSGSQFSVNAGSSFTGGGSLINAASMIIQSALTLPAGILYEQTNGSTTGTSLFTITGTMNWKDGPVQAPITIQTGAVMNISSQNRFLRAVLTNHGTINWSSGNILFQDGTIQNHGVLNATNALQAEMENYAGANAFANLGSFVKNGAGAIVMGVAFTNTGILSGNGSISFPNNNFVNNGTVAPGLSPGILSLDRSPFTSSGKLAIEIIDASGAGTGHDRLDISTNVVLNGTLQIIGGSGIPNGNYTILTSSGNITGNFSSLQLPIGYTAVINGINLVVTKVTVTDICNNIDDDGDGQVDEDAVFINYYRDQDNDGYGNPAVVVSACQQPTGYVPNNSDCDDTKTAVNPGVPEVCNGFDDDCDGLIDAADPNLVRELCELRVGVCAVGVLKPVSLCVSGSWQVCATPGPISPYSIIPTYADYEKCDGLDNNCNGLVDEGLPVFYLDADGDGYGNPAIQKVACTAPAGYVANNTDCNDANAAIHPGSTEICGNSIDNNCNGVVDEGCSIPNPDWMWVRGERDSDQHSLSGKQIDSAEHQPGARRNAATWVDRNGHFWLYGGYGFDAVEIGYLKDMWKYIPALNTWYLIDARGTPERNNELFAELPVGPLPESRAGSLTWTDNDGNLWMMGGENMTRAGTGYGNDLWKFNPDNARWVRINRGTRFPVYGNKGDPSSESIPARRKDAATWTDTEGNLWLFGGYGDNGITVGRFNDLWKYNPLVNNWTWVRGSDKINSNGGGGDDGMNPNARSRPVAWTDKQGDFWLFGGEYFTDTDLLGDLWRYNRVSNTWTPIRNANELNRPGIYGSGYSGEILDVRNTPGARNSGVGWTDQEGNLWLMGGFGYGESQRGSLNDLWKYNPTLNVWLWIKGSKSVNQAGVYGTKGRTATDNVMGSRYMSGGWIDKQGDLWLMGGIVTNLNSRFSTGMVNDLWKLALNPINKNTRTFRSLRTGEWTKTHNWQQSYDKGVVWTTSTTIPKFVDSLILIRTGHIINFPSGRFQNIPQIDQTIIDAGAALIVENNVVLNDGESGDDLIVNPNGNLHLIGTDFSGLGGAGTIKVNGRLNWMAGDIGCSVNISSGSSLYISSNGTKKLKAVLVNAGNVYWNSGDVLFSGGTFINNANLNVNSNNEFRNFNGTNSFLNGVSGSVIKSGGSTTISISSTNSGTFKGEGVLSFGELANKGTISPGNLTGILTVNSNGNLLTPTSELKIEILNNRGAGAGHDQMRRDSKLTLAGKLTITETGSVTSGSFEILRTTSGAITGNFNSIQMPAGYRLRLQNNNRLWVDKIIFAAQSIPQSAESVVVFADTIKKSNILPNEPILAYPNPANNIVYLRLTSGMAHGKVQIRIIDREGRAVKQLSQEFSGKTIIVSIPVDRLINGMYYVVITDSKGGQTKHKVIVQH